MASSNNNQSIEKSEKKFEKFEWFISCYDVIKSFKPNTSSSKSKSKQADLEKKQAPSKSYLGNIKSKGKCFIDTLGGGKKNGKSSCCCQSKTAQPSQEPSISFVDNHTKSETVKSINYQNDTTKSIRSINNSYLQSTGSIENVNSGPDDDSIKVEDSVSNIKPLNEIDNVEPEAKKADLAPPAVVESVRPEKQDEEVKEPGVPIPIIQERKTPINIEHIKVEKSQDDDEDDVQITNI
jgi:hypothetical protein